MSLKIGDKVFVLDDDISGIITEIKHNNVFIETTEGFELSYNKSEVVKKSSGLDNVALGKIPINKILSENEDKKPKKIKKVKLRDRNQAVMEVDLHIHQLVKSEKGMTSHDKKTLQLDTAMHKLEYAIKNKIQKIVFIHGVGEGTLKLELQYLFGRYDNIKFYDADYKKYGLGATEVYESGAPTLVAVVMPLVNVPKLIISSEIVGNEMFSKFIDTLNSCLIRCSLYVVAVSVSATFTFK